MRPSTIPPMDLRQLKIRRHNGGPEDADDELEKRGEARSLPVLSLPLFEAHELEGHADADREAVEAASSAHSSSGDSHHDDPGSNPMVQSAQEGRETQDGEGGDADRIEARRRAQWMAANGGGGGQGQALILRRKRSTTPSESPGVALVSVRLTAKNG